MSYKISWQSQLGIFAGMFLALLVFALIISHPTVQKNIALAVGYSGTGSWTASGTVGGQAYSATSTPTATGYDISGTVGGQAFNYAVTGSFPATPPFPTAFNTVRLNPCSGCMGSCSSSADAGKIWYDETIDAFQGCHRLRPGKDTWAWRVLTN